MDIKTTHQSANSNLRITRFEPLPTPHELLAELPQTTAQAATVERGRAQVRAIMDGVDDRLLVIVGPCSIHDPAAALDYAERLADEADRHQAELLVVLRSYFEKPRTTIGWKGLINDPHLDGTHDLETGLRTARQFLLHVTDLGLPCATEFLEPISPQYLADLISWGAIGARTTQSQIHRQLASGLSMPIGFKNGTDGNLQIALDGCTASAAAQTFLGIDNQGRASLVETAGNPDTHVILRGSATGPNYSDEHVRSAAAQVAQSGLNPRLIIDASHGNSNKDHRQQAVVAREIAAQIAAGQTAIGGVMLESFLVGGAQRLEVTDGSPRALTYGQSVTDACLAWDETVQLLDALSGSARLRR